MAMMLLAIAVGANVLSNAMFKLAMGGFPTSVTFGSVFWFLFNPYLWLGGLSCVVLLSCYLLALRDLGLANSYAITTSLSLVGVATVSALFFREPITLPGGLGIALVIAGILLIGSQSASAQPAPLLHEVRVK